jgi:hypothetical protein
MGSAGLKRRLAGYEGAEFDWPMPQPATERGRQRHRNVVLWPKMFIIELSQQKFDALNEQQRAWVEAANRGVHASVDATYDESSIAEELCTRVRFKNATPTHCLASTG